MKKPTRSRILWMGAIVLSALLYFGAFRLFPYAFSLLHVNITMDLEQALEQADSIAQKNKIGPVDYHTAAMFSTDDTVKTFVELEAGGRDALVAMMEERLYMPYTWRVRHFKEHEKNESLIVFTPDGQPYGFIETISENIPGAQLSEKDARIIAETEVETNWNSNLADYRLVEASQKTEISKRIDHAFVYERIHKKIGEGLYRLKIVVSGDKVTEVTHFVKVPEAFIRRYAEMRSANSTLTIVAAILMLLLYVIGGCCGGLYLILKKRWYIIKQPFFWAIILASAGTLASLNQWPFLWMNYNTAFAIKGFVAQLALILLSQFFAQIAFYTMLFMVAESLTRLAFGEQPQLWALWSRAYSSSYATLGRTVGAYLLVGFNVAFVIGFYVLSLRYLGWWTPSETLFDPNILATYVPWFSPIALSLSAGFMEECLFRAIPLAGAALLGTYFGKRTWWIAVAFIVQAVIFGAVHANYPVQPSYARLLELLIPSLVWGGIYLRFGLLPTIIAHFVYDVIWFSLPIFISHAPDTFSYKIIIGIITLLPLLRVLFARLRNGSWSELPESARNAAWKPSTIVAQEEQHTETPQAPLSTQMPAHYTKIIFMLGIIGCGAWIATTRFTHDGITITVDRQQAVKRADDFLHNKGITLTAPWRTLPLVWTTYAPFTNQHLFIWKKGKKDLYHALLGTYLEPAHWTIRYAQFDTDIVQRAEEYKVMFYDTTIWRSQHILPESSAGAIITQEQARAIAHKTLQKQFNLDPAQVTEISAVQAQLPHRINWLFIFANDAVYPLKTGQARISILIAGDEVVDAAQTIHVPEEWERKEQNKQVMLTNISFILMLAVLLFFIIGAVCAFSQKRTFAFSRRLFFVLCGIVVVITIIDLINSWPTIIGSFNTSVPLRNQLLQYAVAFIFTLLLRSTITAAFMSYVLSFTTTYARTSSNMNTLTGICIGIFVAGIFSCARALVPLNAPLWPSYDPLASSIPLLGAIRITINSYIFLTLTFSSLFILIDTATVQWQKKRLFFIIFAALLGMTMTYLPSLKMLPLWAITGSMLGLLVLGLYERIIRYNYALIPLATGSFLALSIIQQGIFNAYPHAQFIAVINVCVIAMISWIWYSQTPYFQHGDPGQE